MNFCNICTEVVDIYAIGDCNHPICYKCSLKLLKFYNHSCYLCKNDLKSVYYSRHSKISNVHKYTLTKLEEDFKVLIYLENEELKEKFNDLTANKCAECAQQFANLKQLKAHARHAHSKVYCQVCLKEKKEFTSNLEIYSAVELKNHVVKVHEECLFCLIKFYDKDGLFAHLKKEHESCFLCKRVQKDFYFQNYEELDKHFHKVHFACQEAECYEKKFIVFENEIELKSHYLSEHSEKLHKSFRKLDLQITFNSQSSSQSNSSQSSSVGIRRKMPQEFGNKLTRPEPRPEPLLPLTQKLTQKVLVQDIILEGIDEKDVLQKISNLLGRDLEKYSQFISIYEAFKGNLVSGKEFLKIFIETSTGDLREIEKIWKKLADLTPIIKKKSKKKGVLLDLREKTETGNPAMLMAWNDFKIRNSNQISHWDTSNNWATQNAKLDSQDSLSRSNLPSRSSQSTTPWGNRPGSSSGGNQEDFPSLPTCSKSRKFPASASETSASETIEWKKKGKKKVLLHFG